MKIVNTDGMALIGPGSEWFWTALSGIVLAVTFIAIYRQLRVQASANALVRLETLDGRWNSRLLTLARLRTALSLRYGEREPGMSRDMWQVMGFFTDVSGLLEKGHIDIEEVEDNWGMSMQVWTALLRERIREEREREGDPRMLADIEPLAARLRARLVARGGRPPEVDAASMRRWLDEAIARNTAILELRRDAGSEAIPRPPPQASAEVATPTTTA
jgi:hypothetical protein